MADSRFLWNIGSDDGSGPQDYGIDIIQHNDRYYLLGNSAYTYWKGAHNPGGIITMFPRPHRLWWIQPLDGAFNPVGDRFLFWNIWNHWASHAIIQDERLVIATLIEEQYAACIQGPNTPSYNNVQVNMITIDMMNTTSAGIPLTWFNPNKLYMTNTGTGDPLAVPNSFYSMGNELSLIDYPPTFAALGNGSFAVNAPKYMNGKLNLKVMHPDKTTLAVPCGTFDHNISSCMMNGAMHGSYFIPVYNMGPQTFRTNVNITMRDAAAPFRSVARSYVIPGADNCTDQNGNYSYFRPSPQPNAEELTASSKLYPNPASTSVTLALSKDVAPSAVVTVKMKNMLGQHIGTLYTGVAAPTVDMALPAVPQGVYFIEVYANDAVVMKEKLLIK
jgi:hypothetical protein